MAYHLPTDDTIKLILQQSKTIALVGASQKPWRDSNDIMQFLLKSGYSVIPVNPNYKEVLGLQCYSNLRSIPHAIDIVNIFRNPDKILPIIDDAILVKAKTIWMQLGVVNEEAAQRAAIAGLNVVMDRCIAVEFRMLL